MDKLIRMNYLLNLQIKEMSTFLFDKIIFGPVQSRRLGSSLGINLLPADKKICSFNCVYCECGLNNKEKSETGLPPRGTVKVLLQEELVRLKNRGFNLDIITFAGNGEPTMHPEFAGIIDDTVELRDKYMPGSRIAVLSNAFHLNKDEVKKALLKVDDNILKLDSGREETILALDRPVGTYSLSKIIDELKWFKGNLIIQTMFVEGYVDGVDIDNTGQKDIGPWLDILDFVKPAKVMVYTIDRDTPFESVKKVKFDKLNHIAAKVEKLGIPVQVSG